MASEIYMPASWFSNAIHALNQPRRPIAGNGPQTDSARSAMARILAADFASTVLGAHEEAVEAGIRPLLGEHVANGRNRSFENVLEFCARITDAITPYHSQRAHVKQKDDDRRNQAI